MTYYHCSPTPGLTVLEPRRPAAFDKPARVYLTTLLPMALMYGIRNYEYTYGYTKEGQIYLEEYFPNALALYRGKSASLYICAPASVETTRIPNEAVSGEPVAVVEEIVIPDVLEALLEQERLGALLIRRYHELPEKGYAWIRRTQAQIIRDNRLLHTPGPMADYYHTHYPESWADVQAEEQSLLFHGSAISGLSAIHPLSVLHGSEQNVVYLSSCIPYTLLYIWDPVKTGSAKKWVTGWVKDGIVYYEEQFPGQLKTFYDGVTGHLYSVLPGHGIKTVAQREGTWYCDSPVPVYRSEQITDVFTALMQYEAEGRFRFLRFEDASPEKQSELVDRIATYILANSLLDKTTEHARFVKRHFTQAWAKAAGLSTAERDT